MQVPVVRTGYGDLIHGARMLIGWQRRVKVDG
jgi:hypothetical protein